MSCVTNKIPYYSRKAAHAAMRKINKQEGYDLKTTYKCPACSLWHLTSIEKKVSEKLNVDYTSNELKSLRKAVKLNAESKSKNTIVKKPWVVAMAVLDGNGVVQYKGTAFGLIYRNPDGETKVSMKEL